MKMLNVQEPDYQPKATNIDEMIQAIAKLEKKSMHIF